MTDTVRYAAYKSDATTLVLLNLRRHISRRMTVGSNCSPDAGASGVFLVNCLASAAMSPFVLHASTGALEAVPGGGSTWFPGQDSFVGIGAQWLTGTRDTGHQTTLYVNWHSGEARDFSEGLDDPHTPRNLDSRGLEPLGPPTTDGFVSAPPYVIRRHRNRLLLEHEGHRTVHLANCRTYCGSVSVGAGWVTWSRGKTAYAYAIRSHRRWAWRFRRSITVPLSPFPGVQHTRDRVFVTEPTALPAARYRIYELKLPER